MIAKVTEKTKLTAVIYKLDDQDAGTSKRQIFFFTIRSNCWASPPVKWMKWPEHENDCLFPPNSRIKSAWSRAFLPHYTSSIVLLLTQMDNCNFFCNIV